MTTKETNERAMEKEEETGTIRTKRSCHSICDHEPTNGEAERERERVRESTSTYVLYCKWN